VTHDVHLARVLAELLLQLRLALAEVERRQLRAGAALEAVLAVGQGAALQHLGAEGLGEAAVWNAQVAL
jgi:hypothetical protein